MIKHSRRLLRRPGCWLSPNLPVPSSNALCRQSYPRLCLRLPYSGGLEPRVQSRLKMERGESAQGGDEWVAAISVGLAGKRSQRLGDLDKSRYRSKLCTVVSTGDRRTLYRSNCGMIHSREDVWSLEFQAGRDDPPPGPLGTLARSPRCSSISTNQGPELFAWPRNVPFSLVLVSESLSREYSLCILNSDLSTTIMSQLDIPPLRPE